MQENRAVMVRIESNLDIRIYLANTSATGMKYGTSEVRGSPYLLASLQISIKRGMEVEIKYFFQNVNKDL
jgi:hypothetical protein